MYHTKLAPRHVCVLYVFMRHVSGRILCTKITVGTYTEAFSHQRFLNSLQIEIFLIEKEQYDHSALLPMLPKNNG